MKSLFESVSVCHTTRHSRDQEVISWARPRHTVVFPIVASYGASFLSLAFYTPLLRLPELFIKMARYDNTGYGSDSSDEECPSGVSLTNPNRFLFKPTDAQREKLRAGDLIVFNCEVMNDAVEATVVAVDSDRTAKFPLRLHPIYALSRDKLVSVNGNPWPIKHFYKRSTGKYFER